MSCIYSHLDFHVGILNLNLLSVTVPECLILFNDQRMRRKNSLQKMSQKIGMLVSF